MKPSVRASSVDGLRNELKELRRLVMDLKRDQGWQFDPPDGGGGGVPTLFAASANATDKSKSYADFVCSGTADDVDLNAMLAEIGTDWGGRLFLSEGDFNLADSVVLGYGQSIQGLRDATFIEWAGAGGAIEATDYTFVRDLIITLGGSSSIGVDISSPYVAVEGVVMQYSGGLVGIRVGGAHAVIRDCRLIASMTDAILITADQASVQGNYLNARLTANGDEALVLGNQFGSSIDAEIVVGGSLNCFAHNFIEFSMVTDAGTGTQFGTNFSLSGMW